jgi:ParB family chromosome partitioning protein
VSEFQTVNLSALAESKTNPRKTLGFEKDSIAELAASIKMHGVLNPLVVRPKKGGNGIAYEIVAGARRFRAAKIAGVEKVPVHIYSEMDDEQVLEVQTIENLQRRSTRRPDTGGS